MNKFDYEGWKAKMIRCNDESERSPLLQLRFSRTACIDGRNGYLPFFISDTPFGKELSGLYFKENQQTVTNPKRLEAVIKRVFQKTNYENFKNHDLIEMGRYVIKPAKLNVILLERMFLHILTDTNKRNSKSWLLPIQNIILEKQLRRQHDYDERRSKRKGRPQEDLPEDFEFPIEDEPLMGRVRDFEAHQETGQAVPAEPRKAWPTKPKPKPRPTTSYAKQYAEKVKARRNGQSGTLRAEYSIPTELPSHLSAEIENEMRDRFRNVIITGTPGQSEFAMTPVGITEERLKRILEIEQEVIKSRPAPVSGSSWLDMDSFQWSK